MAIQELPKIGLGTWLLTNHEELKEVIQTAWETGYRHIDTAQVYNNESDIGQILEDLAINRTEIFLTTKISPSNYRHHTKASTKESLRRLRTDYIDLVLLHAEMGDELNLKAYESLIDLQKEGFVKHIGVSNFSISGLENLIKQTGVKPYVNQIVCSPTTRAVELEAYCFEKDIKLVGYSILKPYFTPNPFYPKSALTTEEKTILDALCKKYRVNIGQLLNKWALQHNYHVIPKSSNAKRVQENFQLDFVIDSSDIETIDAMNRFSSKEYQESVKEWEKQITDEQLEAGLLFGDHFVR